MNVRAGVAIGLAIPAVIAGGVLTRVLSAAPLTTRDDVAAHLERTAGDTVPGLTCTTSTRSAPPVLPLSRTVTGPSRPVS